MKSKNTSDKSQAKALNKTDVSGSVYCNFCDFTGNRKQLLKNGHCPKCQSPSTKK